MTTGSAAAHDSDWQGVRLHIVTGKGGTGKTTVAAALALALANRGQRVLLVEVEGRQAISQTFDVTPLAHTEARISHAETAARSSACPWRPRPRCWSTSRCSTSSAAPAACWRSSAPSTSPRRSPPASATSCSPARSTRPSAAAATQGRGPGRPAYDAVVLDAPPTGRVVRFLNVNHEVAGAGQGGPDPQPGRLDHGDDAVAADGRPRRHAAGGDACPGDRRRHRRPAHRRLRHRRRRGQPGPRAAAAGVRGARSRGRTRITRRGHRRPRGGRHAGR